VVGKNGVLENKSGNISETRKDRGKVSMDGLELTNALSNGILSPTPYGFPFPKIGGSQSKLSGKRVLIEEKYVWRAYRNSPTLFRTEPSTTPYGIPLCGHRQGQTQFLDTSY